MKNQAKVEKMKKCLRFLFAILVAVMFLGICMRANAEAHIHTWRGERCLICGEKRDFLQFEIWKYLIQPEKNEITIIGYTSEETDLVIPEQINDIPVTSIADMAFRGNKRLTSVTIPDSVTSISEDSFCSTSARIIISPTHPAYTVIDGALLEKATMRLVAYRQDPDVSEYSLPQGILEIGDYAFYDHGQLTTVIIPDSVTSIGVSAFADCDQLTGITIPDSVTSIGDKAFAFCDSLFSITIPDGVSVIGDNPFYDDNIQIQISPMHQTLAIIDGGLYDKVNMRLICHFDRSATTHDIIEGTRRIDEGAFLNSNLTNITIPDSVTSIGKNAFADCRNLIEITIPDGVTSIAEGTFWGCWSLIRITLPDSVTAIGRSAFHFCRNLTSVTIPDGVSSIGSVAFSDCDNLKSVVIPDSVSDIGVNVFYKCNKVITTVARDSCAEQYCINNKIEYMYPDSLDWLKG